ncbi:MAG TPA: DUF1707 domain-containing protein [Streptosporangiaceae bacterium]|jgi:hypothetical protein
MAEQGKPGELARNGLRASHEDRDKIVDVLRVAAGDGRLTSDELDERIEAALTAKTYGELTVLITDLPAAPHAMPVSSAPARELVKIDCRSGQAKRDGRWVVPERIEAKVTSGHIILDFTQAEITQRRLRIDTEVRSGHLVIITRPGIVAEADDVVVRSGHINIKHPWRPEVPEILRIEIAGKIGSGHIVVRAPRRNLWQWLTRQPRPFEQAR